MDSSWRVARRLFFALPPEAAHRLAGAILRFPLPWRRIGGVPADPPLELEVAGIRLRNPVGLAAGFDKSCRYLPALTELGFGYVVAGTVTRRPRRGNLKPRIIRRSRRGAVVNSMGLPNRGAGFAAERLRSVRAAGPVLISLADEDREDILWNHALLEPLVQGVELNVSCPNVSWGRDRDNEDHLRRLLRELGARRSKPLFVKLPPFRTAPEREAVLALARIAHEGGADGLTCFNSLPVDEPGLASGSGGLSGRPLLEHTVTGVVEVKEATAGALPINACGGVFSAGDARACLEAGATTVQVYTGFVYEGPGVIRRITEGIRTRAGELGGRARSRAADPRTA
jgi:dihydroorotate dehydrogenase